MGGDQVVDALRIVAVFLRKECAIYTPALVPYTLQILVLFSAFLDKRKRLDKSWLAASWLWYTTYLEAFPGSTSASLISRVTDDLKSTLDGKPFVWRHRGKDTRRSHARSFDFRHARSRAMALLLAREQEQVAKEDQQAPSKLLADRGADAVFNAIPHKKRAGSWSRRLGSRFLIHPDEIDSLRDRLARGPEAAAELRGHVVSDEALLLYQQSSFQRFVEVRSRDLESLESRHFDQVKENLGLK